MDPRRAGEGQVLDPSEAPAFVEEMLRLRTPSQCSARRVTRNVEVNGVSLRAGDWVLLLNAAANRDPRQFERPDEFDPDRPARGALRVRLGIHQCVGSALARMELRILLETLASHPPLSLAGEPTFSALEAGNHYGPPTCLSVSKERDMSLAVTIDRAACNGYGNCVVAAPDVFDIDPDTNTAVLLPGKPAGTDDAAVLEAVADCPARALKATPTT